MLCWLVPVYLFGFVVLSAVILFICLIANPYYSDLLERNGISPVFMAAFQVSHISSLTSSHTVRFRAPPPSGASISGAPTSMRSVLPYTLAAIPAVARRTITSFSPPFELL